MSTSDYDENGNFIDPPPKPCASCGGRGYVPAEGKGDRPCRDCGGEGFPQEPAFGSPEAVKQAAETIRRFSWSATGMKPAEDNHLAPMLYVRETDLMAMEHSLHQEEFLHRETEEQRDALADALEPLLRALDKVQDWSSTHVGDAMEACEEALRKAGR